MKKIFVVVLILILCFGCTDLIGNAIKQTPAKTIPQKTTQPACTPTTEICDGIDNDCDKLIDEDRVCEQDSSFYEGILTATSSGFNFFGEQKNFIKYIEENKTSLRDVQEGIEKNGGLWSAKETFVSKLPKDDQKKLLGLIATEEDIKKIKNASDSYSGIKSNLPAFFDWRDYHGYNYITDIRNQSSCGSCWAFGAIATLEGHANAYYNNPNLDLDLSEQDLVSCYLGNGCDGAFPFEIENLFSNYFQNMGVTKETCFPYIESDGNCANKCSNWQEDAWKTNGYVSVDLNGALNERINNIKQALLDYGPVEVGMEVYEDFYYYYDEGLYSYVSGGLVGYHAVTIVGFGKYDGLDYWIVKNSWGEDWGEQGYFRIVAGQVGIDSWFAFAVTEPNPPSVQTKNCVDQDSDGYCFWGLGEKPATGCPTCDSTIFDCDDSDSSVFEGCGMINEQLGVLSVNSVPDNVNIFVKDLNNNENWIYRGKTPITFNIYPGIREIKLTRADYEDFIAEIQINEGETSQLDINMLLAPKIISPFDTEVFRLGDLVEIIGTAPEQYVAYTVEYCSLNDGNCGIMVYEDAQPVIEDVISVFDSSVLNQTGFVRITVKFYRNDWSVETKIIDDLYFDSTIKEGWPVKIEGEYYHPLLDYYIGPGNFDVLVDDLDKDGKSEIIFPTAGNTLKLHILNTDGTYFENWPISFPENEWPVMDFQVPMPVVGDIDNDGFDEILEVSVLQDNKLYAFDYNASLVEGFPIELPYREDEENSYYTDNASITLTDLDGDENLEIIIYAPIPNYLVVYNNQGIMLSGYPIFFGEYNSWNNNPAVGNLDDDPELEIIVPVSYVIGSLYIEAFNIDGSTVEGWPFIVDNEITFQSLAVGDIDGNEKNEVVFGCRYGSGLYVLTNKGEIKTGWPQLVGVQIIASPILMNLNNDNTLEIAISDYEWGAGNTYVFNSDGSLVAGWPQFKPYYYPYYSVDFKSPIATKIQDGSNLIFEAAGKRFYGWDEEGNILPGFPKLGDLMVESGAYVGDIDNDNKLELVVAATNTNPVSGVDFASLFVWELDYFSNESGKDWSQFRHDPQHTGLYISSCADLDKDGFTTCNNDCDDSNPIINPNALEICGNGVDEDCDGLIDESDCTTFFKSCGEEGNLVLLYDKLTGPSTGPDNRQTYIGQFVNGIDGGAFRIYDGNQYGRVEYEDIEGNGQWKDSSNLIIDYWVKWDEPGPLRTESYNNVLSLEGGNGYYTTRFNTLNNSPKPKNLIWYHPTGAGGDWSIAYINEWNYNQWHQIRQKYVSNGVTGHGEFYIDGIEQPATIENHGPISLNSPAKWVLGGQWNRITVDEFMVCQSTDQKCGDPNNSGAGPDIADLVYLVNYMFNDGPAPYPLWTANMDGAYYPNEIQSIDIGDLVWLVNYMFNDGEPLLCAPIDEGIKANTTGMTYDEAITMINNTAGKTIIQKNID